MTTEIKHIHIQNSYDSMIKSNHHSQCFPTHALASFSNRKQRVRRHFIQSDKYHANLIQNEANLLLQVHCSPESVFLSGVESVERSDIPSTAISHPTRQIESKRPIALKWQKKRNSENISLHSQSTNNRNRILF